jgi:N-acetylmuramoyl-L-alanine amidase
VTSVKGGLARTVAGVLLLLAFGREGLPSSSSHPDRALYMDARQTRTALGASPQLLARKSEWEKVILAYRKLVARYPQSGYADDALLAVGDLYRQMATRFQTPRYDDDAIAAYRSLVAEYPSSRLGEPALYAVFEIARASGDRRRITEAARAYLDAFPAGRRAADVKTLARTTAAVPASSLPTPPPPGLAQVFNLRSWSGADATRVVIYLERAVSIRQDRISNPDRLYVDLLGTRLHPNLRERSFPVGDGLLEQIRLAQNRDDVVRVVLDFKSVRDANVVFLTDPVRLVIDVRGAIRNPSASLAPSPPPAPAAAEPSARGLPALASTTPPETKRREVETLQARSLPELKPPAPAPVPLTHPVVIAMEPALPERRPSTPPSSPPPSPPTPPQVNRAGNYSLARQLGLGARRIVVDPGHGGQDPGTIGHGGLQEKDLVLDVALRLASFLRKELGADVIMTRSTDVFVPLEERTAIANSQGADLFLSVHANSSRSPEARGIETYFLNFALDPHAEAVAARENAISAATLKDLQGLVKAIALNSKIDESHDFAASIQEAMVSNLRGEDPGAVDRGVHTAPFYVLIGANMPSVLAEINFVSHPEEERLLEKPEHREKIARSLLEGVRSYWGALNRVQTRQLTGPVRGARVASRQEPR